MARRHVRIVRHDPHLEGARALHHFAPDAAQADDAQRLAAQFVAHELLLLPLAGRRWKRWPAECGAPWRASAPACARPPRSALPPGVFITRTPAAVAASRSTLSTPTPARPMTRSFGAFSSTLWFTCTALRTSSASACRQVLRVFLGIGNDHVPAGLGLKQLDPGRCERLAMRMFMLGRGHFSAGTVACAYTSWAAATPAPYCTGMAVGVQNDFQLRRSWRTDRRNRSSPDARCGKSAPSSSPARWR